MRAAIVGIVLLMAIVRASASSCVTVALDVRAADVVAVARYFGDRLFEVDSILRAVADRPSKIVAPEDWRWSPCAPPEPVVGHLYVVAVYPNGGFGYRQFAQASSERALVRNLHPVSARSILFELRSYSSGQRDRDRMHDWLLSAVTDPRREESFTQELLDGAEGLLNYIAISEACHKGIVRSIRTKKLPAALHAISRSVPAVDTEKEFVAERLAAGKSEDDALDEWDALLATVADALGPLEAELRALPWCDHETHGW